MCHFVWYIFNTDLSRQNGSRIFFWDINGALNYATVENTFRMVDVRILSIAAGVSFKSWVIITGHPGGEC